MIEISWNALKDYITRNNLTLKWTEDESFYCIASDVFFCKINKLEPNNIIFKEDFENNYKS